MLISIDIHMKIQLVLDMAIIDLISMVDRAIIKNDLLDRSIKTWCSDAPNIKLEALV